MYLKPFVLFIPLLSLAAYSKEYVVSFKGVELNENERIAAILITARAFKLHKVMKIPPDWSFSSVPEIGVKIDMGAVHGAGFLHSADDLSNIIVLSEQEFDKANAKVSGTLYLYESETEETREVQLDSKNIVLEDCKLTNKC